MADDDSARQKLLTEGVVLALATGFGYAAAYLYEYGFATALGIPPRLISVTLAGGGVAALRLFALCFVVWAAYRSSTQLLGGASPLLRHARQMILPTILGLIVVALNRFDRDLLFAFAVGFVLLGAFHFLWPVLIHRGGTYASKLERDRNVEATFPHPVFPTEWIGHPAALIVSATVVSLYLAYLAGRSDARSQTDFPVIVNGLSERIVVQIYGDRAILGALPNDGGVTLEPQFTMIPVGGEPLTLTLRAVGPLQPPRALASPSQAAATNELAPLSGTPSDGGLPGTGDEPDGGSLTDGGQEEP